ncbi:MAG: hypothetical protein AAE977_04280 [Thermoplasmataceae archaeon]|jgi:CRISPR/Cas system-associated exonuclease Cas4 (RecB family)
MDRYTKSALIGDDAQSYVSASDISQYEYCPVQWYMEKAGFPRDSRTNTRLAAGTEMHKNLGKRTRNSSFALKGGIILLVFSALMIVVLMLI